MQIARVVIVRVIVDGVLGVTVDVHIGHDEVIVHRCRLLRSHFVRELLYQEVFSLHPPSVTVNCVGCYRYNHGKLCIKFFCEIHATNKKMIY